MKRRQLLAASGGAVGLGLAGCLGDGDDGGENGGDGGDNSDGNGDENGGDGGDNSDGNGDENGGANGDENGSDGGDSSEGNGDENGSQRDMSQDIPAGTARSYFEAQKQLDLDRARELLHSETFVMLPDNPEQRARDVAEYTVQAVQEDPQIEAVMDQLSRYEAADQQTVESLLEQGGALVIVEVLFSDSDTPTTTTVFVSLEDGLWKVVG